MKDIALFDYQEEMVARVQEAFRTHQSVMVQMPTGTGKTYLLAAVVRRFVQKGTVWIVAHRRELVAQIEETLARFDLPTSLGGESPLVWVMSIQWLSRHYHEMGEEPSLIVVDEAHHAVADTYAEVMRACPKARKLGLTATPCRLGGNGFTDLFDVLLTSWSMERFMAEGRLSLYDYFSIRPDGADQQLVDSLKKRGADGDYQLKEMNEVMDVRPSLERLCMTVKQYVTGKKGIVYAISIAHAEHLAEFYRQNDIQAVAISSKTPKDVRKAQIEQFRKGEIQVLVSVDLFSEGFDCPDVEFVQLARPTLSLSKYLQMVGRGLRVAKGKDYCVILDNVGLYRRFGLPSAERDWSSLFEGMDELDRVLQKACMRVYSHECCMGSVGSDDDEMRMIIGHDRQRKMARDGAGDGIVKEGNGWKDLRSGIRFARRPRCVRWLGVDFCTEDGVRLYPRIRSKYVDSGACLNLNTLELQVGRGILWKRRYVSFDEPDKVYALHEKVGSVRVYVDEVGGFYAQANPDMALTPIRSQAELDVYVGECDRRERAALEQHKNRYKHGPFYPIRAPRSLLRKEGRMVSEDELWYVEKDVFGEAYWVDGLTGMKHYTEPVPEHRGFVNLLREGGWLYVRNIPVLSGRPLRNWQIVADGDVCVIDSEYLFLKQEPRMWFKVLKRTDDFSCFVVKECGKSVSGHDAPSEIIITRHGDDGVRMECNGVPYVPRFFYREGR